jgi:hypothetical protein
VRYEKPKENPFQKNDLQMVISPSFGAAVDFFLPIADATWRIIFSASKA